MAAADASDGGMAIAFGTPSSGQHQITFHHRPQHPTRTEEPTMSTFTRNTALALLASLTLTISTASAAPPQKLLLNPNPGSGGFDLPKFGFSSFNIQALASESRTFAGAALPSGWDSRAATRS